MCHHRKPIELLAERHAEEEEEGEEDAPETATLTPPADD
jgi:hypothetical protein